jgi:integrase
MRGTIEKLPSGSWRITLSLGKDPSTGKYRRSRHTVEGTKKDAERERTRLLREYDTGGYVEPMKTTVAEYLERWLKEYVATRIDKPRTRRSYQMIVRGHLIPAIGHVKLARLTQQTIQAYYATALASGRIDGQGKPTGEPLSSTTIARHHAVLHNALEYAVKLGYIGRNVADQTTAPRPNRIDIQTWTADEVRRFLDVARGNRYYALYLAAIVTGTRQGELFGLRWDDIDLDAGLAIIRQTLEKAGRVPVFGTPKTKTSRRTLVLPDVLVTALRSWKARQNQERLLLGPEYRDYGLIFTSPGGGPIFARNLTGRDFARLTAAAGVPVIRWHDLRHTTATLLLGAGTHMKIVSEMLGHSGVQITMDTYSHVSAGMQKTAAEELGRLVSVAP